MTLRAVVIFSDTPQDELDELDVDAESKEYIRNKVWHELKGARFDCIVFPLSSQSRNSVDQEKTKIIWFPIASYSEHLYYLVYREKLVKEQPGQYVVLYDGNPFPEVFRDESVADKMIERNLSIPGVEMKIFKTRIGFESDENTLRKN